MTPFEFMVNSFCIAAEMIFLSVGVMIVLAVICGIYNGIKEMCLEKPEEENENAECKVCGQEFTAIEDDDGPENVSGDEEKA